MSGERLLSMPKDIIIAIDGYSGCGKSTTAKAVAHSLGYVYIDSGAMYRAATLFFLRNKINLADKESICKALQEICITFSSVKHDQSNETYLNGVNVESEIRKMEVTQNVSEVSAIPEVRKAMVAQQRALGSKRRVVMDGRDIGTNVFPEAELKIFMTARMDIRAERRRKELMEKGQTVDRTEVKENLQERDRIDSGREVNPLRKAEDAIEIDTSDLCFHQQVEQVLELAKDIIYQK